MKTMCRATARKQINLSPLLCVELPRTANTYHFRTVLTTTRYLSLSQAEVLHELDLSSCGLTGFQVSDLMQAMTQCQEPDTARFMHLDISDNNLERGHDALNVAIAKGWAPTHLSMRCTEYESSDALRKLLLAMASNRTVRFLDLAKLVLPNEANTDLCQALEHFLNVNQTLEELDFSGERTRLHSSRFGDGLSQALLGLKNNKKLQILHIEHQKLGGKGAAALADVMKTNTTLREIYCDHNDMKLFGFTDLVNALVTNKTIIYLPYFAEARDAALRQTQQQIAEAQQKTHASLDSSTIESNLRRAWTGLSLTSTSSPSKTATSKTGAIAPWTDHDIAAALRLVAEGWEDQMRRLQVFLDRNWRLGCGLPVDQADVQVLAGKSVNSLTERPGTASSLSKILEKVILQTTPTAEKRADLVCETVSSTSSNTTASARPPHTPPSNHITPSNTMTPIMLNTPPRTPTKAERSPRETSPSPTSQPEPQTAQSPRTLYEVEIDTTPIFDAEGFDFGLEKPGTTNGVAMTAAASLAGSEDATIDGDADPDTPGEWLMMAPIPPKTRQDFGLGLHVGEL